MYQCKCTQEDVDNLKPLEILIGDQVASLSSQSLLRREGDSCKLLIHPNEDTSMSVETKWIVGDSFLRSFYTIFDWKNKKIALLEPKKK